MNPPRPSGLVTVLALFLFAGQVFAWEIESFDTDLAVQMDGSVHVTETIRVDFQQEEKHGIYRDIPLVSRDPRGVRQSIRLQFLGAENSKGRSWPAELTRHGVYQRIRLGSPDRTIRGRHTFKISYRVDRALRAFSSHDELYWNVTGHHWEVPIRSSSAAVRLPQPFLVAQLRAAVYTGAVGSTAQEARLEMKPGRIRAVAVRSFHPGEGMTIVAGWPRGFVRMPGPLKRLGWLLADNWPWAVPLIVLLAMGAIWWNLGRDLPLESITVRYEPPPGLTPAEVGTLADDEVHLKDITATIIDLARRGYLTLEDQPEEEILMRRRRFGGQGPLKSHEALILDGIFSGGDVRKLSDLKNRFYKTLPKIHSALYRGLLEQRCWWGSPARVRGVWWGIAAGLSIAGWFAATIGWSVPMLAALWGSAAAVACFAPFMPRRTVQGKRMFEQVLGLKEFLQRTDRDRLRRDPDPQVLFERLLPCAMALGVAESWGRAFEGIYAAQPAWYSGSSFGGQFSPSDFSRRVDRASGQMGSALASMPGRSGGSGFGGGFSGGGGGGGGGGSW